ncbi:MAG: glycosyl hydrolase family 18 protein, partial [Candidatus Dormibacteraceae bacterium]
GAMCQALQHSQTTVADTVGQVVGRGIDGVNIDYEGASGACGSSTNQALMTQFVRQMRAALPAADSLTVDTYGASANFPSGDGFFDIAAMKAYVSAFFVMAYELDSGNFDHPPLNCPPPSSSNPETCMSPTSPLSAYKWNDQAIAAQYSSVAGANKVILGLPYYGWASCTTNMNPNSPTYPVPSLPNLGWTANTQYGIQGLNFLHFQTDVHDGVDQWAAYNSSNDPGDPCPPTYGGARELYIDSAASLSAKYQLALRDGLAGVGIWSLDMGGGLPYLWNAIDANFAETPLPPAQVTASPGDGFAYVSWPASAGPNPVNSYTVIAAPGGRSVSVPAGSTSTTFTGLTDGTSYTFTVTGVNGYGGGLASQPSNAVIPTPFPGSYPGRYHPLTNPTRIFDSRSGLGQGGAGIKFGAGSVQTLSLPGIQGLLPSSGVSAVILNVTIADASTPSYVTVSPDGTNPSAVSTINFGTSMSRANMIEVALGANGKIQIYNSVGSVDVILDLMGWVGSSSDLGAAGHFMPQAPAYRTLDTRPPQCTQAPGALCSPVSPGPGGVRTISVFGPGAPAPAQVEAAVLNVTAVGPSSAGYVQVWPTGQSQPVTSSVNFVAGQTVANRVVVPTGPSGRIEIFSSNASVNVLVDVVGWYTSATATVSGGLYTATYPVRALDTRSSIGTARVSPLGPNSWLSVSIAGILGLPASGVGEVAINVTVTNPTSYSLLELNSSPTPTATSDLNFTSGQTIAN